VRELEHQVNILAEPPVVLVGWSWGAMLAWIFAAESPAAVAKLILVAPAAFDDVDAETITPERLRRLSATEQQQVAEISAVLGRSDGERDAALAQLAAIFERADSYDRLGPIDEGVQVSMTIYEAVWGEAVALRRSGDLLRLSGRVTCPITVIHGSHDPHPIHALQATLSARSNVRFMTLERCGHTPWQERLAHEHFFHLLRAEIAAEHRTA